MYLSITINIRTTIMGPILEVCSMQTNRLGYVKDSLNTRKVTIAVFFVAIMIGATFFTAYHHLPDINDDETGRNILVWDMNIYEHTEALRSYRGAGLSMEMHFPATPLNRDVLLKNQDVELAYEVLGLSKGPRNGEAIRGVIGQVDGNSIRYVNAFEGVDLEYHVGVNGLKEYIILNEPPRYLSGDLVVTSQLHYPPSALLPITEGDRDEGRPIETSGFISMVNTRGVEVLRIAPPVVFDSSDSMAAIPDIDTRSVTVPTQSPNLPKRTVVGTTKLQENSEGASLSVIVPWEYLASPLTKYPVTIDPTISSPVDENEWYSDALILLQSSLDIVSGGSLNLYNVTLRVDHDQDNLYNISVASNASFNIYHSAVEPSAEKGNKVYNFDNNGNLTIQDSTINYTNDGLHITGGNVSLRNATIQFSDRAGINATSGEITIFRSTINQSDEEGIKASNAQIEILESNITDNGASGTILLSCWGNVSDSYFIDNPGFGMSVSSNSIVNVTGSMFNINYWTGLVISNSSGLVYDIESYFNAHGINVTDGAEPELVQNKIHNNTINGMNLISASPNLTGNCIWDQTNGAGIELNSSSPNTSGDVLNGNMVGLRALNSTVQIDDLEVKHSSNYGIEANASDVSLRNCTIEFSTIADLMVDTEANITTENTYFNKGNSAFTEAAGQLTVKWYLDIKVLGEFDIPWSGGTVSIYERDQDLVWSGPTDSAGKIPTQLVSEYVQGYGTIDLASPHRIVAGSTDAHFYLSISRSLVIYSMGDMDGDLLPDVLEDIDDQIWYEAEGHGFGESHIVSDPFALNEKALAPWNGTTLIVNRDSFHDTIIGMDREVMVAVRARSMVPGDTIVVELTDETYTQLMTVNFQLDTDYFWYLCNWIPIPPSGRILINVSRVGPPLGDLWVDCISVIPLWVGTPDNIVAFDGQITNPVLRDTDGDIMPDGAERRNGSMWFEGELLPKTGTTDKCHYNFSSSRARELSQSGDQLRINLKEYLVLNGGPLPEGHYVVKIRANSTEESDLDVTYSGTVQYQYSLSIDDSTLTWYTALELWVDPLDDDVQLNITWEQGTVTVDKVGLLLIVDDPDEIWNATIFQTVGETPAISDDHVFVTGINPQHFTILNGETGQVVFSNGTGVQDVTSPTVTEFGVVYAFENQQGAWIRLINGTTGNDSWCNTTSAVGVLGQAQLGEQIVQPRHGHRVAADRRRRTH